MIGVGVAALAAMIVAHAVTPAAGRLAHRVGCVAHANPDVPTHRRAVPLLGGLAIVAGLAPWLAVAAVREPRWVALAIALVPLVALGAYKDRVERPVAPVAQLIVQAIAAGVLWAGGFRVAGGGVFGSAGLTIALAIVVINAWNFIDILDGLAASVAAASAVSFALGGSVVAAALAGASIGYVRHNWPPARIFMGDVGSFTIGLTFVALILDRPSGCGGAAMLTMIVPLGDFAFTVVSRIAAGKSPMAGGAEHLPLRLIARGWSGVRVNVVACAVAIAAGVIAARM
jgi:UDP-N-acetylmuramyl pentapeptide phosphotransferase/UDP-N-acetylglucosamine-1-phosphate transferase